MLTSHDLEKLAITAFAGYTELRRLKGWGGSRSPNDRLMLCESFACSISRSIVVDSKNRGRNIAVCNCFTEKPVLRALSGAGTVFEAR